MAQTLFQLAAAITPNQTQIPIQNIVPPAGGSSGFPSPGVFPNPQPIVQIDGEFMVLVQMLSAGLMQVRSRGYDGTAAVAHDILASGAMSPSPGDFQAPQPGNVVTIDPAFDQAISLGQTQTIPPPQSSAVYNLNAPSAITITLPAPTCPNGVIVTFTSLTAFAHIISALALINDGVAGAPHGTVTFTARQGASITLISENGLWNVLAQQNVAVS